MFWCTAVVWTYAIFAREGAVLYLSALIGGMFIARTALTQRAICYDLHRLLPAKFGRSQSSYDVI